MTNQTKKTETATEKKDVGPILVGDLIFTYGTLMPGERACHFFDGKAEPIIYDYLDGATTYDLGSYPGLKLTPDVQGSKVYGHVMQCTDPTLGDRLDRYEGFPTLYNRVKVKTRSGRDVWVYTYNFEFPEDQKIHPGMGWPSYRVNNKKPL